VERPVSEIVNPPDLPPPRGFSHGVKAGNTIYLAGQIGGGETFAEQFDNALENLLTVLTSTGGEPGHLVSMQLFVTDVVEYRESAPELSPIWRKHFGRHYPAMGLFGVTGLADPAAKVEVMGIAVIDG
jgi:enamine deaminase RidA (YjgF/YER057c/UK114 family)